MIFSEFVTDNPNASIFKYLNDNGFLDFETKLTDSDITKLETGFEYANSLLTFTKKNEAIIDTLGADKFIEMVGDYIGQTNSTKWKTLYETFVKTLPAQTTETYTGSKIESGTNSADTTTTNSISAYDSVDMVNDSKITNNGNGKTDNNISDDYTKTINSFDVLTKAIDQLTDKSLYDIIYSDIRNSMFITTI